MVIGKMKRNVNQRRDTERGSFSAMARRRHFPIERGTTHCGEVLLHPVLQRNRRRDWSSRAPSVSATNSRRNLEEYRSSWRNSFLLIYFLLRFYPWPRGQREAMLLQEKLRRRERLLRCHFHFALRTIEQLVQRHATAGSYSRRLRQPAGGYAVVTTQIAATGTSAAARSSQILSGTTDRRGIARVAHANSRDAPLAPAPSPLNSA